MSHIDKSFNCCSECTCLSALDQVKLNAVTSGEKLSIGLAARLAHSSLVHIKVISYVLFHMSMILNVIEDEVTPNDLWKIVLNSRISTFVNIREPFIRTFEQVLF